jgi:hypothetical protein
MDTRARFFFSGDAQFAARGAFPFHFGAGLPVCFITEMYQFFVFKSDAVHVYIARDSEPRGTAGFNCVSPFQVA